VAVRGVEMKLPKCRTKYCLGLCLKSGRSPFCSKCRTRHWRERNPISYFFAKLRTRAKERGHAFSLTREQFAALWQQKGLNGGKTKFSLSFHRIRNGEGYHHRNVELRTLSENSRLRFVPFFKNKADEEAAISETSAQIRDFMAKGEL